MRYKIKAIKSRRAAREVLALAVCVAIFFLCFAISGYYSDRDLPNFLFEQHKKASAFAEAFLLIKQFQTVL